jgi:hypothetical protein
VRMVRTEDDQLRLWSIGDVRRARCRHATPTAQRAKRVCMRASRVMNAKLVITTKCCPI